MLDALSSSRLFQYMRQAVAQPVAPVAPAYGADQWVRSGWQAPVPPPPPPPVPPVPPPPPPPPITPASVDPSQLWGQLQQRYTTLLDEKNFVTGLYRELLGREPDASGLVHHMYNLEQGRTRDQVRQDFLASAEYQQKQAPAPAPVPAPAALPPISIEIVRQVAHDYVNQHPEIKDLPSYEARAAVSQLREGVIAELNRRGYKAGRILGPDGVPYDQCVAFGNAGDAKANAYRVTAGGGRIERAIDAGYCDDPIAWSDVH